MRQRDRTRPHAVAASGGSGGGGDGGTRHTSHELLIEASLRTIQSSHERTSSLAFVGSKAIGLNQKGANSHETITAQSDQQVRQ